MRCHGRHLYGWPCFIITITWLTFPLPAIAAPSNLLKLATRNGTTQNSTQPSCPAPAIADYFIFLAGNFFSHAATIINRPGAPDGEKKLLLFFTLLFPGVGIVRAYDVFIRFVSLRGIIAGSKVLLTCCETCYSDKSDEEKEEAKSKKALHDAARAGALAVITRSKKWQPRFSELAKTRDCKLIPKSEYKSPKLSIPRFINLGKCRPIRAATGQTELYPMKKVIRCLIEVQEQKTLKPTVILSPLTRASPNSQVHGLIRMTQKLWEEYEIHILPPDAKADPPPYGSPIVDGNTQVPPPNFNIGGEAGLSGRGSQATQTSRSSRVVRDNPNITGSAQTDQNLDDPPHKYQSLSSFRSFPKIFLSIIQLLFGSTTLIHNPGEDLIRKYGSSAFSLAVAPYVWMSFINLLANMLCPQYPNIYLVRNSIMDEVEERMRVEHNETQTFFGVVGHLRPKVAVTNNSQTDTNSSNLGDNSNSSITAQGRVVTVNNSDGPSSINGEGPPGRGEDNGTEANNEPSPSNSIGPVTTSNGDWIGVSGLCEGDSEYYASPDTGQLRLLSHDDSPSPDVAKTSVEFDMILQVPSCEDFEIYERWESTLGRMLVIASRILILVIVVIPPIAIYVAVSQFHPGPSSTSIGYGFTLAWLWTGQTIGCVLGWAISFIVDEFEKTSFRGQRHLWGSFCLSLAILASATPAIGGYVEIMTMFKGYGNCMQLS